MARPTTPSTDTQRLADLLEVAGWTVLFFLFITTPLFTTAEAGFAMSSLVFALVLVAGALAAGVAALKGRLSWMRTGSGLALVLYAVVAVVAVVFAPARRDAVVKGFDTWLSVVPMLVLLLMMPSEPVRRRRLAGLLLTAVLVVVAVTLVYGVYQFWVLYPELEQTALNNPEVIRQSFGLHDPRQWGLFMARVESRELYSTFFLSNTFAGFMVLTVPVLLGMLFDYRRTGSLRPAVAVTVLLALSVFNIAFTGSKGGWVAMMASLVVMLVLWRRDLVKRWWPLLVPAGLVLGGLAGVVMFRGLGGLGPVDSMVWRLGYWRGTVRILEDVRTWLVGIGPGNFKSVYGSVKPPASHEVGTPHNDLLWVLVTFGIGGLVTFAWTWVGFFRRAALAAYARDVVSGPLHKEGLSARKLGWGLAVAVLLSMMFLLVQKGGLAPGNLWTMLFWAAVFPVVAVATAWAFAPLAHAELSLPGTRVGIVAGVAGLLVHGLVDFLWEIPGIALTALVLVAVWHALRKDARFRRAQLKPAAAVALGVVPLALVVTVQLTILRPVADSRASAETMDNLRGRYMVALRKADGGPLGRQAVEQARREMLDYFDTSFTDALQRDPGSPELHEAAASMYQVFWHQDPAGNVQAWRQAMEHYRDLARLRPNTSGPHRTMAHLAAARLAKLSAVSSQRDGLAEQADEHFKEAVRLNPTLPELHLEWAVFLESVGRHQHAAEQARRAIELDRAVTQVERHLTPERLEQATRLAEPTP